MSRISVIIPSYNSSALIRRTIDSVRMQTADLEIIVVDDCSTDETIPILESINDDRIKIIRQRENQGPAAARNRGLDQATGCYCAFLDGDDYWEKDFLQETANFLDLHPDVVAVSVMQCHRLIGKEPAIVPCGTGLNKPVTLDDFFAFWERFNHVCTGSVLFRTDVARQIGGQRKDLRICEDLEFWAMLALQGKWSFIPKVLYTSDGEAVTRKQGWLEKNMIRWKSAPTFENWSRRIDNQPARWKSSAIANALGRIARNLCYCHIMSHKDKMARQEVLNHGKHFPRTHINSIFRLMSRTWFSWKIWCSFLRFREYHRHL